MPGRQHDDARRLDAGGREVLEHVEQAARIVVDRPDARRREDLRERALHHVAVLAARTRRRTGSAGCPRARRSGRRESRTRSVPVMWHQMPRGGFMPDALRAEATSPSAMHVARDDAVLEDLLVVVDVVDEQVQRVDALLEAALDPSAIRRPRRCAGRGRTGRSARCRRRRRRR